MQALGDVCLLCIDNITTLQTKLDRLLNVTHLLIKCAIHAPTEQGLKKCGLGHRLGLGFSLSLLVRRRSLGSRRGTRLMTGLISTSCIPGLRSYTVEEFQDVIQAKFSVTALGRSGLRLRLRLGTAVWL